jgi:hypothetical protein
MNKKINTLLFIIGGTVFNIVLTALCFVLLFLIFLWFLYPQLPQGSIAWMIPVNFIASVAASWFIYRWALKTIAKKVEISKYINSVFTRYW